MDGSQAGLKTSLGPGQSLSQSASRKPAVRSSYSKNPPRLEPKSHQKTVT